LLDYLRYCGFTDSTGIDPYAPEHLASGVKILRKTLEELGVDDKFDVIIFNHSLEHVPDQLASESNGTDGARLSITSTNTTSQALY
jgi:hypothetical protein